jgi:hypothetical protein
MYLVKVTGDSQRYNFHKEQEKFHLGHRVRDYIDKTVTENQKKKKLKQLFVKDG